MKSELKVPRRLYERLLGRKDQYGLYSYLLPVYERYPKDFQSSYGKMILALNKNHFGIETTDSEKLFGLFKDGVISNHIQTFRETMNAIIDRALLTEDMICNAIYRDMDLDFIYFHVLEVE